MKKKKLCVLIIMIILVSCFFAGCSSSVDYLTYTDSSGNKISNIYINLDHTERDLLNASAQTDEAIKHIDYNYGQTIASDWSEGDAWTIEDYLRILISYASDYEYLYTDVDETNAISTMYFTQTILAENVSSDSTGESNYSQEIEKTFFSYEYDITFSSPFDGLRESYDETLNDETVVDILAFNYMIYGCTLYITKTSEDTSIYQEYIDDGWEEYKDSTVNSNNLFEYYFKKEILPPMKSVFPILENNILFNMDDLTLQYIVVTSSKLFVDDPNLKYYDYSTGVYYYYYPAYFSSGDKLIQYTAYRANGYGYYTASAIGGILAIGIVFLIIYLRKRKAKKQEAELASYETFTMYGKLSSQDPYNNEYNNFQNLNENNNDHNPFDGY